MDAILTQAGPAPKPVFSALLIPHRSLSRQGFTVLMAFLAVTCLISGLLFAAAGAWPVFGFLGLDVAAIWLAFTMNYRAGRVREEIAVFLDDVIVRQYSAAGRTREHRFNPLWTRFNIERHDEIGITRMALRARGGELEIGSFLNPADRESFATALNRALSDVRRR